MKTPLLLVSLLVTTARLATAGPGGINLGWLDCPGQGSYQLTRTFACDTNSGGGHTMVGTFVAGPGMLAVTGYLAIIEMQTSGATLSRWWELRQSLPAGCRAGSMAHSSDFTAGPLNCFDYWQGGAIGGASGDFVNGNRTRLRPTAALPAGDSRIGPIAEGVEVYTFKLTIDNAKSVGSGSCGGCQDEACIVLNSILVTQVPGTPGGNFYLTSPAPSAHVVWQGWSTLEPLQLCPAVTPVKNRTWGSIKSVYR